MSVGDRMCTEGAKTISELTGEVCIGELKREEHIKIEKYLEDVDETKVCAAVSSGNASPERGFFMLLIPRDSRTHFSMKIAGKYSMEKDLSEEMSDDLLQEMANILSSRMLVLLSEGERASVIHKAPVGSLDAVRSFRNVLSNMMSKGIEKIDLIDMDFILPEKRLSVHILYRKDEEQTVEYGNYFAKT